MSSEPPEEPHLRSEPSLLSPASPKPIHFPAPTNIPVLEMQMDVGFNQTEAHMSDPAMHNTDVRPDVWRDPKEAEAATATSSHQQPLSSAGGEALPAAQEPSGNADTLAVPSEDNVTNSNIDPAIDQDQADDSSLSVSTNAIVPEPAQTVEQLPPSSDPSVSSAEAMAPSQDTMPSNPNHSDGGAQVQMLSDPVNVQALWDTLNPAHTTAAGDASNATAMSSLDHLSAFVQSSATQDSSEVQHNAEHPAEVDGVSASVLGVVPSGLPPRPPPQEQPLIHPNYVHSQHIRDYHPHASNPAFQPHARSDSQGNVADPNSKTYVPPVHSPSSAAAAAIGGVMPSQTDPVGHPGNLAIPANGQAGLSGQPAAGAAMSYTPTASSVQDAGYTASPQNMYGVQYPSATGTPVENRREKSQREGEQRRPEDRPWDAEVQRKYDRFIEEERGYVSEGRWEQFPQGSRLFVGNLSSEKVTKRDIFHVFHTYGELAQISIKQAYGFVQFLRTEDCMRALQMEQGTQIRDKKIHLEVSKPQKNRTQNNQRRSRSPPEGRSRPGSNVDRYVSGSRGGNNRGNHGGYRSPSPRNFRDRHDDRYRRRSRSPDYNRGNNRYRSPSPRRDTDDDLPLPHRAPRDVPDVQIIVLDTTLDRDFISWVEQAFSTRGLRVGVLRLAPHLSEHAVVRRQIIEGVVAVVKHTRPNQNSAKIGLQIFDRSQGANNVKFEEYEGLDPPVAVQLVQRAKTSAIPAANPYAGGYAAQSSYHAAPPAPNQSYATYGAPSAAYPQQQHGYQQSYNQSTPVPPNLQNLITNLEPNHLQNLLSAMSTPQSANNMNAYAAPGPHGVQQGSAVAGLHNNPALVGYLQQQQQQQQQQQMSGGAAPQPPGSAVAGSAGANGQVMRDILARLGTGQR